MARDLCSWRASSERKSYCRGGKGKAKEKESTKLKVYTLLGSSEFFFPLIDVEGCREILLR